MRTDNFPSLVSDPEALGLPGTADYDSTAGDDVDTGRVADGPDPALLPLDRDDQPLGLDHADPESLDDKLDRELPDTSLGEAGPRPDATASPIAAESFDPDATGETLDSVDRDTALDDAPVEPDLGSQVSMYDTGAGARGGTVGRLVEPDEGTGEDTEKDAIAYDAGAAGGGATAEELAVHEIPER
ncbi:DUF5709 domain-containing protein [Dactylosporangium sp. CA-152071]|uniref:DUF5709 domain-containing protein n=1 Tax=Dactylosporangium sp. CA-152071 TaxID=3239933 RepID=UPI003D935BD1